MRYALRQRVKQTVEGVDTVVEPVFGDLPGDPEEAWKRRISFSTSTRLEYEEVPS